jgi:hypothetical protein
MLTISNISPQHTKNQERIYYILLVRKSQQEDFFMESRRTLYFEGAGCAALGDLPNCRIRTAFHLDDGRAVYLELSGVEVTRYTPKALQGYKNRGHVDHCYCITGTWDNGHSIHDYEKGHAFEYCAAEVLALVNSLGASFDAVEVLPDLAAYRVHGKGRNRYNYADKFTPDRDMISRREAVKAYIHSQEVAKGHKYPCFSIWADDPDGGVLHFHNCKNGDKYDIRIAAAEV